MDFDAIVVGAGPGGCLAARDLARAGFSIGLFDTDNRENLSNTIIVEVERKIFDTIGVRKPEGDEIIFHQERMRVFSPRRKECFTVEGQYPTISVRLDQLVKRLLAEAEQAGVKFFGNYKAIEPIVKGGRIKGATFDTDQARAEVKARLVIDATGFNAVLTRQLDPEMGIGFEDREMDMVIAGNYFHEIDVEKAKAAIHKKLHYDDEIRNCIGIYGNYSTEYSYLSLDKQRAYILIGVRKHPKQEPLQELIDRFRKEQGYYGMCLYGGKAFIRTRRSWDKLVADGFMVIGGAACQVTPVTAAGVSAALHAGHLAARAGARALKDGNPDTAALWPYSYQYQAGRGSILATYDAGVAGIRSMRNDYLVALMEAKVMQPEDVYNVAVPAYLSISLCSLPTRIWGLLKNPSTICKVVNIGAAILKVKKHYANYPRSYDKAGFEAWNKKNRQIFAPLEAEIK
ncbi:MAG: NAD(P)/FAD-dependent oxidoreductase [Candidatus Aminicenantes bacterium]|nr:MAG: NAD(P)/FAD-dependent oxidoreductase [Candidatus Aminicenantes bacterium]